MSNVSTKVLSSTELSETQKKMLSSLDVDAVKWPYLTPDLIQGLDLIYGLQSLYSTAPQSEKKNQLALTIAEGSRILLQRINAIDVSVSTSSTTTTTTADITPPVPTPPVPTPPVPTPPAPKPPKPTPPSPPKPPTSPKPPKPNPCDKYKDDDSTMDELVAALKFFKKLAKTDPDFNSAVEDAQARLDCKKMNKKS
jgi:outer membrane biosynthesis protein TonB